MKPGQYQRGKGPSNLTETSGPRAEGQKQPAKEATVSRLNIWGDGEVVERSRVIKLARCLPGDRVRYRLDDTDDGRRRYVYGHLEQRLASGPDRVESGCPWFAQGCGGCQWLDLDYDRQVEWKQRLLAETLKGRLGRSPVLDPLVPALDSFGFRNKLSVRRQRIEGTSLVFMQDFMDRTISPQMCRVQEPLLQEVWAKMRSMAIPQEVNQIHLRADSRGKVGINLFLSRMSGEQQAFGQALMDLIPGRVCGVSAYNGYQSVLLCGEGFQEFSLGGFTWRIALGGFFQTNTRQAALLLDRALEFLDPGPDDRILDLYCGCGFFTLPVAARCREAVGVEFSADAVSWARDNGSRAGLGNCSFYQADARLLQGRPLPGRRVERSKDLVQRLANDPAHGGGLWPDRVFVPNKALVDPPRAGLGESLCHSLGQMGVMGLDRVVYVSCSVESLGGDLKHLQNVGWRLIRVQGVDMFPHSSHLEIVALLEYQGRGRGRPGHRAAADPGGRV